MKFGARYTTGTRRSTLLDVTAFRPHETRNDRHTSDKFLVEDITTADIYISKVTSICYYHLRRLRQIRNYVSRDIMIQLVISLVISRIDYCNSVLVGLPASTLAPLQRVQNAVAWLILGLSRWSHITPALKQIHWLQIKFCITFKVVTLISNIFHQCSPSYLRNLVTFSLSAHQRQLRSSTTRSRSAVVR